MDRQPRMLPDLEALVGLFHPTMAELGEFQEIDAADMPDDYRRLLAHRHHMTVTVEEYHQSLVDVEVLDRRVTAAHYARKILLRRRSDRAVVQYGVMRVHFDALSDTVRAAIESESIPLGRILIENKVLREIHLTSLWKVAAGGELGRVFGCQPSTVTYGRTALIDFDNEPAVELVEIVAPVLE